MTTAEKMLNRHMLQAGHAGFAGLQRERAHAAALRRTSMHALMAAAQAAFPMIQCAVTWQDTCDALAAIAEAAEQADTRGTVSQREAAALLWETAKRAVSQKLRRFRETRIRNWESHQPTNRKKG